MYNSKLYLVQCDRPFFLFVLMTCLWLGSLLPLISYSQCTTSDDAFINGEEITYIVSYNWGPIWVDAGIVTFKTKLELKQEKPAWHLISTGRTFKSYDFLFKVRDTYETWLDTTNLQTIEFQRYIYEGGFQMQNKSWFDYSRRLIFSNLKINDTPMTVDTFSMAQCTYDMLASVYYVRSLNLDSIQNGDSIPVNVALDDGIYTISVRRNDKEIIEHPDGTLYPCNKFSAKMIEGTIFTKGQEMFVWVSDDPNKIPIYIEAKILVGSVKAYLKEAKGLKQPLMTVKPTK